MVQVREAVHIPRPFPAVGDAVQMENGKWRILSAIVVGGHIEGFATVTIIHFPFSIFNLNGPGTIGSSGTCKNDCSRFLSFRAFPRLPPSETSVFAKAILRRAGLEFSRKVRDVLVAVKVGRVLRASRRTRRINKRICSRLTAFAKL